MIKEYINELLVENKEKLDALEKQMKALLTELDGATKWMETLQAEMNVDKNIFSPRMMDAELEEKLEDAKSNIQKIKQDIDYVKSFMEENAAKEKEYGKLLEELEQMGESDSKQEPEKGEKTQQISEKFLADLYRKTEFCLASLYSDRNKCKSELKTMKAMIKDMMEKTSKTL